MTAYLVQGVGEAGHQLGVDELGCATLELGLFLDGKLGGFHAELGQSVCALLEGGPVSAIIQGGASVGTACTLHLHVGLTLDVIEAESICGLQHEHTM